MTRTLHALAGAALALALAAPATAASAAPAATKGARMPAPIVFFDIAGPDMGKLADFYEAVFGWSIARNTPFPGAGAIQSLPVAQPLPGTLRGIDPGDDPQARKLIYLGVDDINATLAQVTAHGGTVQAPRFEVKGVVVLALFKDPAGNAMGLIEMNDGKPKVP